MKLRTSLFVLREALALAGQAADPRSARMPLRCIRLTAEGAGARAAATDSDLVADFMLAGEVDVEEPGQAIVPVRLTSLLAGEDRTVEVETAKRQAQPLVRVTGEGLKVEASVIDPDFYPTLPTLPKDAEWVEASLDRWLRATWAVATAEHKVRAGLGVIWAGPGGVFASDENASYGEGEGEVDLPIHLKAPRLMKGSATGLAQTSRFVFLRSVVGDFVAWRRPEVEQPAWTRTALGRLAKVEPAGVVDRDELRDALKALPGEAVGLSLDKDGKSLWLAGASPEDVGERTVAWEGGGLPDGSYPIARLQDALGSFDPDSPLGLAVESSNLVLTQSGRVAVIGSRR